MMVSVIVPIYNQEKYLNRSIPSILNQSYRDIEVILVNDGSTDRSFQIIQDYKKRDSRIIVVEKSNGGLVDATLAGINVATGEYTVFLDPDDTIGEKFIETFFSVLDSQDDIVAFGFYYEDNSLLKEYTLHMDQVFVNEDLQGLRSSYLMRSGSTAISNTLYISRWNKIYRTSLVKKVADKFKKCKSVSLGEDTIFTFFALQEAKCVKTIKRANSYFYNIGNSNSMMNNTSLDVYLSKCEEAYRTFAGILIENGLSDMLALELYYCLISALWKKVNIAECKYKYLAYDKVTHNATFINAVKRLLSLPLTGREKIRLSAYLAIKKGKVYYPTANFIHKFKRAIKRIICSISYIFSNLRNQSLKKLVYTVIHKRNREIAFEDLMRKMPVIEKRIKPIISQYFGVETDLKSCPIENNVFVFWWDGFDSAPQIVNDCFQSVRRFYPDSNVIQIDKYNYPKYTDICDEILVGFKEGKISVQTFSDILRFNLLKNNGGVWIDSTIFFSESCDIISTLKEKSFDSLMFSTSEKYMKYEDITCSWSGYYISSRKHGVLVTVMDEIFHEYYRTYKSYDTYFFIDAALMICKKNKIDNDVLAKTTYNSGNMFTLARLLDKTYNKDCLPYIQSIPQKLFWSFQTQESNHNSFYSRFVASSGSHGSSDLPVR